MEKPVLKALRALIALGAVFFLSFIAVLLVNASLAEEARWTVGAVLKASAGAALFALPVVAWLVFWRPRSQVMTAYALEELDLDEDELRKAVSLWVFATRDKRVEGEPRFLEDDSGGVSCRVAVRRED